MLVSTVVATDPANPTARIGAMSATDAAQRINVAASRARDRMILVHSVDPERLPTGDLRASLIRHCRNPLALDVDVQNQLDRCDSEFERMVMRRIVARGYARVRSQVHVGADSHQFRIDLVVDGPESRLAVECDGERWHGEERWHADRTRQEVLERAGWTFSRIRGSAFFRDPEAALEPLWQRLDELGIPTGDEWLEDPARTSTTVLELRGLDLDPSDTAEEVTAEEVPDPLGQLLDLPTEPSASAFPVEDTGDASNLDPLRTTTTTSEGQTPGEALITAALLHADVPFDDAPSEEFEIHQDPVELLADPVGHSTVHDFRVEKAGPASASHGFELKPYRGFVGGPFAPVAEADRHVIADGIREIVSAEGPMLAARAYRLYVVASGGQRVGGDIKSALNSVVHGELRKRRLAAIPDGTPGIVDRTLFLPGTASVVLRELGARELTEIPMSEVYALIQELGLAGQTSEQVSRAVLKAYGLSRLTARSAAFLRNCQEYRWRPEADGLSPGLW
ncbi:hypothetical protein ACWKWC_00830 [Geodermatophilus nigrescens]